jgi:peptidyl-prolyl cis-trans isomerase B (cyclophilin B)
VNVNVNVDVNESAASDEVPVPVETQKLPLFDVAKDGPLLKEAKNIEITTNAGPITLHIDPALAPITATQMYRLLTANAFVGTRICGYQPNYLVQIAVAEDKAPGQSAITDRGRTILRRLPLEVDGQKSTAVNHRKYALSMGRYPQDPESGVSSFSIILQNSPHLDHEFAVFGNIQDDAATLQTLSNIAKDFEPHKYWITGAKELPNAVANLVKPVER